MFGLAARVRECVALAHVLVLRKDRGFPNVSKGTMDTVPAAPPASSPGAPQHATGLAAGGTMHHAVDASAPPSPSLPALKADLDAVVPVGDSPHVVSGKAAHDSLRTHAAAGAGPGAGPCGDLSTDSGEMDAQSSPLHAVGEDEDEAALVPGSPAAASPGRLQASANAVTPLHATAVAAVPVTPPLLAAVELAPVEIMSDDVGFESDTGSNGSPASPADAGLAERQPVPLPAAAAALAALAPTAQPGDAPSDTGGQGSTEGGQDAVEEVKEEALGEGEGGGGVEGGGGGGGGGKRGQREEVGSGDAVPRPSFCAAVAAAVTATATSGSADAGSSCNGSAGSDSDGGGGSGAAAAAPPAGAAPAALAPKGKAAANRSPPPAPKPAAKPPQPRGKLLEFAHCCMAPAWFAMHSALIWAPPPPSLLGQSLWAVPVIGLLAAAPGSRGRTPPAAVPIVPVAAAVKPMAQNPCESASPACSSCPVLLVPALPLGTLIHPYNTHRHPHRSPTHFEP
jgi:hypothetical protein